MLFFLLLIGLGAIAAFWLIGIYNNIIALRNRREQAFADIDVQLKQRSDMIPQLVEVVKGYASHERGTLEKVIAARNEYLAAGSIPDKIQADTNFTSAFQGLKVTLEAYPDLKANTNFVHLQQEIADIENKLAAARRFFNAATTEYNTSIEMFPNNQIAKRYNFNKEPMYNLGAERREQLDEAPKFSFN